MPVGKGVQNGPEVVRNGVNPGPKAVKTSPKSVKTGSFLYPLDHIFSAPRGEMAHFAWENSEKFPARPRERAYSYKSCFSKHLTGVSIR
jgi:hypothetical protein